MGKSVKLTPHYAIAFRDEFNGCGLLYYQDKGAIPGNPVLKPKSFLIPCGRTGWSA